MLKREHAAAGQQGRGWDRRDGEASGVGVACDPRTTVAGTYRPQPVRRVTIPKPDGGQRELGIPTVTDRLIQQALLQVLQPMLDPTYCPHRYGFRPGRSADQAVQAAQAHVESGRRI